MVLETLLNRKEITSNVIPCFSKLFFRFTTFSVISSSVTFLNHLGAVRQSSSVFDYSVVNAHATTGPVGLVPRG